MRPGSEAGMFSASASALPTSSVPPAEERMEYIRKAFPGGEGFCCFSGRIGTPAARMSMQIWLNGENRPSREDVHISEMDLLS